MKKSTELIKERAGHIEAQQKLHDAAEKEKRDELNEQETKELRELNVKIKSLSEKIADAEAFEENLRSLGTGPNSRSHKPGGEDADKDKVAQRYSLHRHLYLHAEGRALDGVEKEMNDEANKQARAAGKEIGGIGVPTFVQKRFGGQSVTQDAGEYGAALVETDTRGMIDFLRPRPVLESLGAQFLTDLQGDASFIVNEGGITANWEGEIDQAAESKNKYTRKGMKPKRLAAVVPMTIQNLRQSSIDLEAYTRYQINSVMANALDLAAINGSGTNDHPVVTLICCRFIEDNIYKTPLPNN